jgi:threonine dehydratase
MVPSFSEAMKAGKPVSAYYGPSLADGLAVPVVGPNAFAVARHLVDGTCLVGESMLALAVLRLVEMEKMVAEGGGAIALAAILPGGPLYGKFAGKTVVLPICGGNVDTPILGRVLERGLAVDGRLIQFDVRLQDRPGGVAGLTKAIAECGGSIKVGRSVGWSVFDLFLFFCLLT